MITKFCYSLTGNVFLNCVYFSKKHTLHSQHDLIHSHRIRTSVGLNRGQKGEILNKGIQLGKYKSFQGY